VGGGGRCCLKHFPDLIFASFLESFPNVSSKFSQFIYIYTHTYIYIYIIIIVFQLYSVKRVLNIKYLTEQK
jgi:hypothetical protein